MPKRNLRVVKWLGQVPAVGVFTLCNRQFKVPLTTIKRVADAQESLSCSLLNTNAKARWHRTQHCQGIDESALKHVVAKELYFLSSD